MTRVLTQYEKAIRLRDLHHGPAILVLPNAWDAGSARIFEDLGFPAIGTSSAGVAFTLGYPDGQAIPRDQMLFMLARISSTVDVPVTADIERAYGADSLDDTLATVRAAIAAGAVGINLEDSRDGEAGLVAIELQVEKIRGIRKMGDEMGVPVVLNARTDAFHMPRLSPDEQLREATLRLNAYFEAGACSLFAPFVDDASTIRALVGAVRGPLNILALRDTPPVPELEAMGVRRLSVGGGPSRAALGIARRIGRELLSSGTYEAMNRDTISYAAMNELLAPRYRA